MTIHAANEGESSQGVLVGFADGTIRQMASTGVETVEATVLSPAIGGKGYCHAYEYTVEYSSQDDVALTMISADEGNGSYGPAAVTLPSTGGVPTKLTAKFGPNKWQWAWFQFTFSDPAFQFFMQGFVVAVKPWGRSGGYEDVLPFASEGGEGGQA